MEGQCVCWNHIFECEKIFRSFTSQFQPVLKCSDLVQEMQTNSLIISNFNFLCYDIEPRINKEINLLEIMEILIYWKTCSLFSRQCNLFPC